MRCFTWGMWRKAFVTMVILLLTIFAVGGQYRHEGKVILRVTQNHGVHEGDVPLWLLAGLAICVVWTPARQPTAATPKQTHERD